MNCVEICKIIGTPNGFYGNSNTNICDHCDNACYTCDGLTNSNCLRCSSNSGSNLYLSATSRIIDSNNQIT